MDEAIVSERRGLVDRAKAMILKPKEEWPRIAAEPTQLGELLKSYVLPLAAIGPVASFIGGLVFGYGGFGFTYRPSFATALSSAIIGYVLAVASFFVLALIADFLAPKFGGVSDRLSAFKLVAYSSTAAWLAGIFGLVPALAFFGLLGLYSAYLLYTGATPMMKVPKDKAANYTIVTIICAVILAIIATPIAAALSGLFGGGAMVADQEAAGSVTIPGGGSVDLAELERMGKQMEQAANGDAPPPLEASRMQDLLPAAIGPYQRSATETMAMGAMGSTAQGTYTSGDNSFTLQIADMSAMGALAGLGAALGVEQSREDANGYQRTATVEGQMQTEEWNNASSNGKFGRVFGNRFMVQAEGSAESIDQLKAAVAAVDTDNLTAMVK